jgi:cytidine deaminase
MNKLIKLALDARKKAYAPYSGFKVGAALESAGGKIYLGCNVENASYGLANCAERTALFKAVSDGVRKFKRIAIVTSENDPSPPCGICRQALSEFAPNLEIIMANTRGKVKVSNLSKLFPDAFKLRNR